MTYLSISYMRLRWLRVPTAILMLLLQRLPLVRALVSSEFVLEAGTGAVLKGILAGAAALGAVQTVAGATTFSASVASPAAATVGQPVNLALAVTGAKSATRSYKITGTLAPGLSITGLSGTVVNSSTLAITGTPTTAGSYTLSIKAYSGLNGSGDTNNTSYSYQIDVAAAANTDVAPTITTQPSSVTVTAGGGATFTVAASGSPTPTFQWKKDGSTIASATSASYSITVVAAGDAGSYTVVVTNSAGTVTSAAATLTVNAATVVPTITTSPSSQSVAVGSSVTFSGAASGNPTPTYQWRKDGVAIGGATSSSYTISTVSSGSAGSYTIVATNSVGSVTSSAAVLTVTVPTAGTLAISQNPVSQTVAPGGSVTFSVAASGGSALSYQWIRGSTAITGATASSLTLTNLSSVSDGRYWVRVSDAQSNVLDSRDAYLWVATPELGGIINESVRTSVGPDTPLTVGFVVDGGSKSMLVRAVGPTLLQYGLTDALPKPRLELNQLGASGSLLATNAGWNGDSSIGAAAAQVGAFTLLSNDDAAILRTLVAAPHTAVASSATTSSGTVNVEAYAVDGGGQNEGKLLNLSARKRLDDANPSLTAGFALSGNVPQRLLIRAVGPSLAPYLGGAELNDSVLTLNRVLARHGEALGAILTNDDYGSEGNAAEIATVAASVGAFPLIGGAADAAVLVTLPTGNYTVEVGRKGAAVGDALIEVYAVP